MLSETLGRRVGLLHPRILGAARSSVYARCCRACGRGVCGSSLGVRRARSSRLPGRRILRQRRLRHVPRAADPYARTPHPYLRRRGRPLDVVPDLDLLEVAHKAPQATLCLESALSRHGLTDEIPDRTHVALPRRARAPSVGAAVCWHRFAPETFLVGRTLVKLAPGVEIGLYSPERSIVDAFRLREREGHELAHEALKRWLRKRNQPAALLRLAKHFPRTLIPIRKALELLL